MNLNDYHTFKENSLHGRYITLKDIEPLIKSSIFNNSVVGFSFLNKPIYKITIGKGKNKILVWSQMHGNESTGTKAIFDLLNYLSNSVINQNNDNSIINKCTIIIIPMLNPDGAEMFTRENAQKIDLNRDAVALKAKESKVLNTIINDFKPNYCFNLHDQRDLFSVSDAIINPATLSFLAPSVDIARSITKGRKETMGVIVGMVSELSKYIQNNIGRFTDEFYPSATGDNFQKAGFNTILIEAGHYPNDLHREETRKYNFLALLSGINFIVNNKEIDYNQYFDIPINEKKNYEVVLSDVNYKNENVNIGLYYQPKLIEKKIVFSYLFEFIPVNTMVKSKQCITKNLKFNSKDELVFYISNL